MILKIEWINSEIYELGKCLLNFIKEPERWTVLMTSLHPISMLYSSSDDL